MEIILTTWETIADVCISTILIFVAMLVVTRIAGLRTFAKMSSLDFASTIALGTILSAVIMNDDQPVLKGAAALVLIIGLQVGFARLNKNSDVAEKMLTNKPIFLLKDGQVIQENLDRSGVSYSDLMAKLREANAFKLEDVRAVVFETTGDVAVLHASDDSQVDEEIFDGVEPV